MCYIYRLIICLYHAIYVMIYGRSMFSQNTMANSLMFCFSCQFHFTTETSYEIQRKIWNKHMLKLYIRLSRLFVFHFPHTFYFYFTDYMLFPSRLWSCMPRCVFDVNYTFYDVICPICLLFVCAQMMADWLVCLCSLANCDNTDTRLNT